MSFSRIYRRYHQDLYRYCLSIVGSPEDAEDALQNTMLKAMRALRDEKREIKLKPWLYRIAHNESIDLIRKRRPSEEIDPEVVAGGLSASEAVETRERLRGLIADLGELPERQRGALTMREMAGLSFEQIGGAFNTSAAVARQTVYEARLGLQQMREGREMSCDDVRRALSDGDGRIVRRRDIRAHLRDCSDCRAFQEAIGERRGDFAALAPLPAIAAAGLLRGLLAGGGSASGAGLAGTVGAGAGKAVATSTIAKSAATVAVVAAVGAGAADRGGLIDVPVPGAGKSARTESTSQPQIDSRQAGSRGTTAQGRSSGKAKRAHGTPGTATSKGSPARGQGKRGNQRGRRGLPAAARHGQQTAAAHRSGRGGRSAAHTPARAGGSPAGSRPPKSNAKPRSGDGPSSPTPPPADVAPDKPSSDTSQPSNPGNSGAPRASANQTKE